MYFSFLSFFVAGCLSFKNSASGCTVHTTLSSHQLLSSSSFIESAIFFLRFFRGESSQVFLRGADCDEREGEEASISLLSYNHFRTIEEGEKKKTSTVPGKKEGREEEVSFHRDRSPRKVFSFAMFLSLEHVCST